MKLYRETFRRLTRLGLVLLAVTVTVCSVVAYQDCMRDVASNAMLSAPETFSMPLMVFVYVGSLTLAFAGFSFLNRRADSDFYHSLPISRIYKLCKEDGIAKGEDACIVIADGDGVRPHGKVPGIKIAGSISR